MKNSGLSQWRKLDNAALAFPAVTGKEDTRVFRFYCQLKEEVNLSLIHIFPFFQKLLAAYKPYVLISSHLTKTVFCIIVMLQHYFLVPEGKMGKKGFQRDLPGDIFFTVQHINISLGKIMFLFYCG